MTNTITIGITPQVIDPAEQFIILQTPAGQAVLPNSTMDTRKSVDVQSTVDGCRYVCRIYNFTANTMHYVFEMDVVLERPDAPPIVNALFGLRRRVYLLDNADYCMAYVGDDLSTVFNVIVNEAKEESAFLELYTDDRNVEDDFKAWADGRESEEAEDERPDVEDDFRY